MRRKIFALFLVMVFAFSQFTIVDAKGSSGKSSSSGSRSISKSSGYSGSSSSKSSGSSSSSSSKSPSGSSSSSGGYSGSSSSRSVPNSYSGSSSSSKSTAPSSGSTGSSSSGYSGSSSSSKSSSPASSGSSSNSSSGSSSSPSSGSSSSTSTKYTPSSTKVNSKTDTLKNSYMQEQYKKQASTANYSDYKSKLNDEQKKVYESSFNRSYNVNNRLDFDEAIRTRPQRINVYNSRPIIINYNSGYFGGPFSYGSAFAGPWDLWFLMRASEMFWYHHWHDIHPYRNYFDDHQFRQMEERIRRLEQQNIARDPNYLEPGIDPDLQFSSEYTEKNLDRVYYTNKYSKPVGNPWLTIVIIVLIVVVLIIILRKVSRPRAKKNFDSRIY